METKDCLANYYEGYDEDGRLISKHGMVEYLTTMKYVEKYLKPNMRVLEIGAATGRYSHALAQKGYRVDAVELVEHNIEIFKQNTVEGEPVTITQGNAIDLSAFESDTYDITLLLGPMYHLFTTEDKLKALSEAIRVTKKGGVVFAAYCMGDASVLSYGFIRGEIYNIIENPSLTVTQAIELSKVQTYGMKGQLLACDLSFLGWVFLSMMFCAVPLIWVNPYMVLTDLGFYAVGKTRVSPTGGPEEPWSGWQGQG